VGFYPLVNIWGKQIKTDVYIANPTEIQGKTTIGTEAYKKVAKNIPTTRPELIKMNNL